MGSKHIHSLDRRSVLQAGLCGLAAFSMPRLGFGAAEVKATVTSLTDKLTLIAGVGGNVVARSQEDGLVLIDSGAPEGRTALMNTLRELPGNGRVSTLFNTHWHREQTGSNEAFGRTGAKIIAHEKSRLWLATDHWLPQEDRYEKAWPKEAHPTESFYTGGKLDVGGEQIEYGYLLEAHTAGDIYVFFRNSNVLVVGDAASPQRDPLLDWFAGGWLGGRIDALALLLKLGDEKTRIVAASGPVIGRAELQLEHDVLLEIFNRMVELMRKGYTTRAMLDAGVMQGLSRSFADPDKFVYDAHKSIWAHHNTLSHDIV